jgi:acyl-CoA synthetase (AMP-forming)/AMP-acid ligase II
LEQAPVVALLAGSSFETILTFLSLNRLGYATLFLSTRLTASAYARLMDMANCHNLIIHESFRQVATDIESERPDYRARYTAHCRSCEGGWQDRMDLALVWKHWLPQADLPDKPSMSGKLQEELQLEVVLHFTTIPLTCTYGVWTSTLHQGRNVLGKSQSAHHEQQPP